MILSSGSQRIFFICTHLFAGLLPFAGIPSYAAAKWGVVGFTTSMAVRARLKFFHVELKKLL